MPDSAADRRDEGQDGELDDSRVDELSGEPTDRFLAEFYGHLRALASSMLSRESAGQTLQATALVHEAYMRLSKPIGNTEATDQPENDLFGNLEPTWQNRAHFLGSAAETMRRVLIDHARKKKALKRGGGRKREDIDLDRTAASAAWKIPQNYDELISLDSALKKLEDQNPEKASVVKLRYFAGLTVDQTAETLGISAATCKRYWAYSKVWLKREME